MPCLLSSSGYSKWDAEFCTGPNPEPTIEESKDCNRSPSTVLRKVFVVVVVVVVVVV